MRYDPLAHLAQVDHPAAIAAKSHLRIISQSNLRIFMGIQISRGRCMALPKA